MSVLMSTTSSLFRCKCFMKLLCYFALVPHSNFNSTLSDLSDEFITLQDFYFPSKYRKCVRPHLKESWEYGN